MNNIFYILLEQKYRQASIGNRKRMRDAKMPNWVYPSAIERSYGLDITAIMRLFKEEVEALYSKKNIESWLQEFHGDSRNDGFSSEAQSSNRALKALHLALFGEGERVRTLVYLRGSDVSLQNSTQFQKYMQKLLGTSLVIDEPWEREVIEAWSQDNFNLISSLADEYIKKVNNIVSEGVQFGKTSRSIMEDLQKVNKNMTASRAKLIARDQVGKIHGQFTKRRMLDVGINMYTWATSGDERVRETHREMSNKVCRWDDNTVYSADGVNWVARPSAMQGLIPGQDIQCRCTAIPHMTGVYDTIEGGL